MTKAEAWEAWESATIQTAVLIDQVLNGISTHLTPQGQFEAWWARREEVRQGQ